MAIVCRPHARNGVDQQQGRVFGAVDGLAHRQNIAGHARRGFVVHHAHGPNLVLGVSAQALLNQVGLHATAPVLTLGQTQHLGLQTQFQGQFVPQGGEVSSLIHHHGVAGAAQVHQRRLPSSRAGTWVDHHWVLGLKNFAHIGQDLQAQTRKLGATVVDGRLGHGAQDAVRHR